MRFCFGFMTIYYTHFKKFSFNKIHFQDCSFSFYNSKYPLIISFEDLFTEAIFEMNDCIIDNENENTTIIIQFLL
jgi:hypothetical protein